MFKNLKKEARCITITSIFLGLIFVILLIVSLVTKLYGLVIGWSIGYVITIFSMFLLFQSGKLIQQNSVGNGGRSGGLVAVFYISRFALYAIGLVFTALAYYTWNCSHFQYALFTCLCALLPSHIFIALLYHDNDDAPIEKKEENKENINK